MKLSVRSNSAIVALGLLLGGFITNRAIAGNLLINPGAETGTLSGWTVGGTSNPRVDNGTFDPSIQPHTGDYDFIGGSGGASGTLKQNVNLLGNGLTAGQIDTGILLAQVNFFQQSLNQSPSSDTAGVNLTFLNAGGSSLGAFSSGEIASTGAWNQFNGASLIPSGTRSIDYTMNFIRNAGNDLDAFIDDNSLTISPSLFAGLGLTGDPTAFSQYVSPNTQQNFSSWNPGPYSSPLSLGSNGYTANVEAKTSGFTSDLKVISPGSLTTKDAGAELIYTSTSGKPTGIGGYMRLVDADGNNTSGGVILNSFITLADGTQTSKIGPTYLSFDPVTGFDLSAYGLPSSFFIGGFLKQSFYAFDPTVYFSGISLQPNPVTSSKLFATFDTAGFGASTQFTSPVPEPSTVSLLALGVFVLLKRGKPA